MYACCGGLVGLVEAAIESKATCRDRRRGSAEAKSSGASSASNSGGSSGGADNCNCLAALKSLGKKHRERAPRLSGSGN